MPNSLHDLVAMFAVVACLIIVIHPRLPTGVFGTAGLGTIMVGVLYSIDDQSVPEAALDMVVGGIVLVAFAVVWHITHHRGNGRMRRLDDWLTSAEDYPATLPPGLRDVLPHRRRTHE